MAKKLQITSNWSTLEDQPLTKESLGQLFSNEIPCVRHKSFLSPEECQRILEIAETAEYGHYDPNLIYPLLSTVGITQFDYANDMEKYFSLVHPARSLQRRFIEEAGVDIIGRVASILEETSGIPVRMAKEGDNEYFAGIVRVVDGNYIALHADYGPFDDPPHEIGRITGQITWNILLKQVPGGETLVHDRPWQGKPDSEKFQRYKPHYAYSPDIFEGRIAKVVPPIEGDLTIFNSRNFHEVRHVQEGVNKTVEDKRCTVSSFIGNLPEEAGGPALILWS